MSSASGQEQLPLGGILKRLARNSLVYGIADTLGRAISFFLLPVYTAALSPGEYGIFATVNAFLALAVPLAGLGLAGAAARFHVDIAEPSERDGFYGGIWWISLAAGVVLALAGATILGPVLRAAMPGVPYSPFIRWSLLALALLTVQPVALARLQMDERPFAYLVYGVGYYACYNLAILTFAVWRHEGALGVVKGQALAAGVAAAGSAAIVGRGLVRPSLDWLGRALRYGLPLVPHVVAGWFIAASDRLLLQRYLALAVVGVYSVAYQFAAILDLCVAAASRAWSPMFLRINAEEPEAAAKDAVARLTSMLCAALAQAALLFAAVAPFALRLLVNPSYHDGARLLPVLVASAAVNGLYYLVSLPLMWRGRTGLLSLGTVAAGTTNVAVNIALIPRYGAMGAALATLAAYVVLFSATATSSHRVFPIPYEARLVLLAALTGAFVALLWVAGWAGAGLVPKLVVCCAFPVALRATGYFRPSETHRAAAYLCRMARRVTRRG